MLHGVLIGLHAASGVITLVAGILALSQNRTGPRYWSYLVSLTALVAFMIAAIITDWPALSAGTRGTYLGLTALGLFMLWRGSHAGIRLRHQPAGWRPRYLDDIGFTLISLFDGFVVVTALDLGAPVWQMVVIAVIGIVAGVLAMRQAKTSYSISRPGSRLGSQTQSPSPHPRTLPRHRRHTSATRSIWR